MRLSKLTLRKVALKFVYFQTRLIVFLFPERLWYQILFQICRKQQYLLRLLLMLTPFRNDPKGQIILIWLMESTLLHLFSFGRPFPIPIRQKNLELICNERTNPNGLVLCSLHLPFVMVSLRLLMESGVPPTAVVANSPPLIDGRMPVFSTAEDLPGPHCGQRCPVQVAYHPPKGGICRRPRRFLSWRPSQSKRISFDSISGGLCGLRSFGTTARWIDFDRIYFAAGSLLHEQRVCSLQLAFPPEQEQPDPSASTAN